MNTITSIKTNRHRWLVALILFFSSFLTAQDLYINEFLASNSATITDESGEFEDWIEIYNPGTSAINLAGYYITDDPTDLTAWKIPFSDPTVTTIPPGGYLILWADKAPKKEQIMLI